MHESTAVASNGERVCTKCGVVIDGPRDGASSDTVIRNSKTANLYHLNVVGSGNRAPNLPASCGRSGRELRRRVHHDSMDRKDRNVSMFSNACDRISLPVTLQQAALSEFQRISDGGFTAKMAADRACYAIYVTCVSHGIATAQEEIISAVRASYNRKKMPTMTKIMFRYHAGSGLYSSDAADRHLWGIALRRRLGGRTMSQMLFEKLNRRAFQLYREVYVYGSRKRRMTQAIDYVFV